MSVEVFYLAKAAEADALAERAGDDSAKCSLRLTAETWRLLARLAEKYDFSDLPAVRLRVPLAARR